MDEISYQQHSDWHSERIFVNATDYYESLLVDIGCARKTLDLDFYIFEYDVIGRRFVDALILASARGVHVRVIVDGIGSAQGAAVIGERLVAAGIDFKVYHPLPWYTGLYNWSLQSGGLFSKMLFFIMALNRRNHRKLCVIDSEVAWCGSFNISCDHLRKSLGGKGWRDCGVRLQGLGVLDLRRSFDALWYTREPKLNRRVFKRYLSNLSERFRNLKNEFLINRIKKSEQRVWICSAYFAPSGAVIRALRNACRSGVDVRVIVPAKSDVWLFPILTATYYQDLISMGVRVFEYQPGVLHAKLILIDGESIIGSSNINHRSLLHDLELDVVLDSIQATEAVEQVFADDLSESWEITDVDLPRYKRTMLLGWLPRLIRYWM